MSPTPHRQCPDDEVLQELAAGISSPELAEQTMHHVGRCSICGPILRRYLNEFSAEESPENARILRQLQSSKPEWQRGLVRKLIGRPRRATWLKMVPAFAALAVAILAVLVGPSLMADLRVRKAKSQVAAAFADRRTTEMRLPSVAYAPYKPFPTELSGNSGGRELDEMPPELTSASSAANENLKKDKVDPQWLQVQGRALLWASTSGSLERAEKDFEKARAEGLNSPSLEIDLAASYFERDSRAEHPNLQRSLNLLSEVLSRPKLSNEDRASALYNLAIAYEKTQAWDLAVATWEKYLEVDSSSPWSNEARQHLKDGKAKISAGPQQSYSDPSFFLQQRAQGNLKPEDPEQYQQKALSLWLPEVVTNQSSDAYRAAQGLSEIFAEHHDFWWKDFLEAVNPAELPAVQALRDAVNENDAGHYDEAEKQAIYAAELFAQSKNEPGELRASFEEVYARRRILNGADCIARADPLAKRLSATNYHWLAARVTLERADCRNLYGELAESDANLEESRKMAGDFRFPVLLLQNMGISAGMKHLRGDCDASWKEAVAGLDLYWKLLHLRSERLFQFYAVMLQCSLETGSLQISGALLQHLIAMRQDQTANIQHDATIEGLLHLHLANVLLAQKEDSTALRERKLALKLLDQPDEPSVNKYRLVSELEPAEFQLEQGDAALALSTLSPVLKLLPASQDRFFRFRCQKLLGDIYLKSGKYDDSVAQYRAAIETGEVSLDTISNQANRLAWLRATDDSYRGLVRGLLALSKDREALEQWEWYQSRPLLQELHAGGHALQPVGGANKNSDRMYPLSSSTGVRVIYADFKDGLQIWITKGQSFRSQWVRIDQQDFEQLAHDFIKRCATESSNLKDLQTEGAKLYSLLVQPILNDVAGSPLITVELDRRIYNLPLEALQSPEGQYFAEKYMVVYSLGTRQDGTLHQPQSLSEKDSLLLLDATHSPRAFLPGMAEERNAVIQAFPHTSVVDAAGANWSGVRRSIASSVIFHYMGHGRPEGTGTSLLFNETRPLRALDFTPELFRRSQLVVLAACSGAKGEDGLLDTDNLVHAFLSAGVPRVIASQWNVDAESTSQIMQAFYRSLSQEKTVAQALFDARNQVLKKAPHPYYWAGFSLAGVAN